jgi:hypothetical protein
VFNAAMARSWLSRLFGAGKMPDELKARSTGAGVLCAEEGISVKISGRGVALPGLRSSRSVSLKAGSVVLGPRCALASVGRWVALDSDLGEAPDSPHTVEFAADGMHLHVELTAVYPSARGTFDLHFRVELGETVLAQLPTTPRPVRLPEGVALAVRSWA